MSGSGAFLDPYIYIYPQRSRWGGEGSKSCNLEKNALHLVRWLILYVFIALWHYPTHSNEGGNIQHWNIKQGAAVLNIPLDWHRGGGRGGMSLSHNEPLCGDAVKGDAHGDLELEGGDVDPRQVLRHRVLHLQPTPGPRGGGSCGGPRL